MTAPSSPTLRFVVPRYGADIRGGAEGGARQLATKLAADIVRSIGGDPAWAWPDPNGDPANPDLEQAVEAGLFTRVVVFGDETAAQLLGTQRPGVVGTSAVCVAAGLDELASRGAARAALWRLLRQNLISKIGQHVLLTACKAKNKSCLIRPAAH